jgi:hypothetical protein
VILLSISTPQRDEAFRVEIRGRSVHDLKRWVMAQMQSVQPCPDSVDPRRACPNCEAWAVTSALLGDGDV